MKPLAILALLALAACQSEASRRHEQAIDLARQCEEQKQKIAERNITNRALGIPRDKTGEYLRDEMCKLADQAKALDKP